MLRSGRRGFTLVEMMIAISVVGLMMLVGLPRAQAALRKAQLRSARNAVINLYQQARTRAINENRLVTVNLNGTSVWVTAQQAGRLIRIDARTRAIIETVETGNRPYALDITRGRAVWVTLLDEDGVRRVRFYRR